MAEVFYFKEDKKGIMCPIICQIEKLY